MRLSITLFLVVVAAQNLAAQCEPTAAVRAVLDRNASLDHSLTMAESDHARKANLEEGLADNPHDYFLLRRLMRTEEKRADEIAWAERMRGQHPDQPVYALLQAMALVGKDTGAAVRDMEALEAKQPPISRAYAELAGIFESGKQKDLDRARRELEGFLKLCPAPLEAATISLITRVGAPATVSRIAADVRKRLEPQDIGTMIDVWEALWRAEFKAHPVTEHDALRKQIAADLARLEKSSRRQELRWVQFLHGGYESAGDLAAANRINEEILTKYPRSEAAKDIVVSRWRKERPYPQNGSEADIQAYRRESLAKAREWLKVWPGDTFLRDQEFNALRQLDGTAPDDVVKCAERLLADYRKNPNWYGMPPVEFRVASEFVKNKVHLDQVPVIVAEAYSTAFERNADALSSDRYPDDVKTMIGRSRSYLKLERAKVMIDYYAAVNRPERLTEVEADLASIQFDRPGEKASLLEVQGKAAEAAGRKMDSLLLYRSSMMVRESPPRPPAKDELPAKIERLFKELGGTPATYALLTDKSAAKPTVVGESRWERPKKPIPSFTHTDLEGKTWKLAALEGKTVLINLWATWCGPCRSEHPDFQKLYDKLKGRSDVSVISFNIDDDTGKVAPYMKENKYTFPVLLASETVNAVLDGVAIPQNWFVDAKGKLQWLQVGYGSEPNWQDMMTAKLEEVAKAR